LIAPVIVITYALLKLDYGMFMDYSLTMEYSY